MLLYVGLSTWPEDDCYKSKHFELTLYSIVFVLTEIYWNKVHI